VKSISVPIAGIAAAAALDHRWSWGTLASVLIAIYCHRLYRRAPTPAAHVWAESPEDELRPGWAARWGSPEMDRRPLIAAGTGIGATEGMARTRVDAERLRFELARRGWDGCDLATAAGLSAATVSSAIQGRSISTVTLRKMVLALSRAPTLPGVDDLVSQDLRQSRR
jgi:hypothetical protein